MQLDFSQILPSLPFLLSGAWVTLQYTGISVFFGLLFGIMLAMGMLSNAIWLRWLASSYISVFRGTPLLVQLTLIYFGLPQVTGYRISTFEAGVLTFSLNSGAYICEIIRAGIASVDVGQREVAFALGVSPSLTMRAIILPQAIKNILPALVNEVVDLLKESSLVSVLGEADLLRRANLVAAEKYLYFEPLLVVSAMYYLMVMILSLVAKQIEKRMQYGD